MKQPFRIDFSAEELATVFATCVSCFDYALVRAPSDDGALRLSVVRLRLTRWGEAVNIYKESGREQDSLDLLEDDTVNQILVDLIALFEYPSASTQEPAEDLTFNHPTNVERPTQALLSMLETIASDRSRWKSLLSSQSSRFGRWPTLLVRHASELVDQLEGYFPAAPQQRELCAVEKMRFKKEGTLSSLESVASGIDPWMSANIPRHTCGIKNPGLAVGGEGQGGTVSLVALDGMKKGR